MCFISGLVTTVITCGFIFIGHFFVSLILTLLFPGLFFAYLITKYYKAISVKNKIFFTLICSSIYFVSALITAYLNGATHGVIIIVFSVVSLCLVVLSFNSMVKKLTNLERSLGHAVIGGLLSGILPAILENIITKSNYNFGESGMLWVHFNRMTIFALWQTSFALTIK